MKRVVILVLAIVAVLTTAISFGTAQRAEADTIHHNESSDGDLSAEPLSPAFVMVLGVNTWSGTIEPTSSSEADSWVATLPAGHVITAVHYSRAGDDDDATFTMSDPNSGVVIGPTISESASTTFDPPLSTTGDYKLEITTDSLNSAKTWTVEITVDSLVADDTAPPVVSPVSISSDNADTTLSRVGDTITVEFTTDEDIATPAVTIGGASASVSDGPTVWTASRAMVSGDAEGVVALTIDATDLAGNAASQVISTTDGSAVTFDISAPTISPVMISSDNADLAFAMVDDTVTLSFTSDEPVQTPTVTIGGDSAAVTGGPTEWSATRVMLANDTEGEVQFTIDAEDLTGEAAAQVTSTTDGSSVTFDATSPVITSASIFSDNADSAFATSGNTVTLDIITDEAVRTPIVTIGGVSAVVTGGPTAWSASRVMAAGEAEGAISLTIDAVDLAGNAALQVTSTTDGSSVTFDDTSPGFTSVSISSNNANPAFAKVGDTVTIAFTSNESLLTPMVAIGGDSAAVTGGPTVWSASHVMVAGDAEGIVAFTIDATDLSGRAANRVTSTTNSSSVTFDETAPEIILVSISSDNNNPALARIGDTVFVDFITSEDTQNPTVSIGGSAATVMGESIFWSGSRIMLSGDTEGTVAFSINATDLAGNVASPATATTDGSAVIFDKADLEITTVSIRSNNANTSRAKAGNRVTIDFETNEAVQAPAVSIRSSSATVVGGPTDWSASRIMVSSDAEGVVPFTIDAVSLSGQPAPQANSTTDGSSVSFDKTAPDTSIVSATVEVGDGVFDSGDTQSTSISLSFDGTDNVGVAGFTCRLDGGTSADCTSPVTFNGLSQGSHTVRVTAIDNAGNVDATPAGFSWKILGDVVDNGGRDEIDNICDLVESLDIHHGIKNSLKAKFKWLDCHDRHGDDDAEHEDEDDDDHRGRGHGNENKDKHGKKDKGKHDDKFENRGSRNSLIRLINQVRAQRGRQISFFHADIFIAELNVFINGKGL